MSTDPITLMVTPGKARITYAVGQRVLVVSPGMVDAVYTGRIAAAEVAGLMARQIGLQRSGLLRSEAALRVLLIPWHLWLGFILVLWQMVGFIGPLRKVCLGVALGDNLYLAFTDDPRYFITSGLLVLVFLTWWAVVASERTRHHVGDAYVIQAGLGPDLARIPDRSLSDDHTRNGDVRLRTTTPVARQPGQPVHA